MPVTVLIADDSPFMLKLLNDTISTDPNLKVIGTAKRGVECITQVITKRPRVVVLDIMLPDESGLNIVYQIMRARPTAVVLFSSLTAEKVKQDSLVFNYGIVDFVSKPPNEIEDPIAYLKKTLIPKVHTLAKLNVQKFKYMISTTNDEFLGRISTQKEKEIPVAETKITPRQAIRRLIVIGASTGGPSALAHLFSLLPSNLPPILVVQHMPPGFIESFAVRLDKASKVQVQAAEEGMILQPGHAYVAQGGKHMVLEKKKNGQVMIKFDDGPLVNFVKPSVDVTILSAAEIFRDNMLVVIMTGMGKDGLQGSRLVKKYGGKVLAQSKEDSVIYGMNKAVVDAGLADRIMPVERLAKTITEMI